MPLIHGTAEPRFSALKDAFAANFDSGLDIGAAVAVYSGGRLVADLWGGMADPVARKPWTRGTLVNIWSVTKAVMAVLAATPSGLSVFLRGMTPCALARMG